MTRKRNREVLDIVTVKRHRDDAGFVVNRASDPTGAALAPPFQLLDELGPADHEPESEVVSLVPAESSCHVGVYLMEGQLRYTDSLRRRRTLRDGDLLWATIALDQRRRVPAARLFRRGDGRLHGLRFVIAPSRETGPAVGAVKIPVSRASRLQASRGKARGLVLAGPLLPGQRLRRARLVVQDWTLDAGAEFWVALPAGLAAVAYVVSGTVWLGDQRLGIRSGQVAILGVGDKLRLTGAASGVHASRVLLFGAG